jgi:hypothetical protein
MSVKARPYRNGGWEVDIRVALPDGSFVRERRKAPVNSRSGAIRWGEARERVILFQKPVKKRKEVPTLEQFYPRFLDGYATANRHKPSGIAAKETVCRVHLVPVLGGTRLDAIGNEEVQRMKAHLGAKNPKTVNNILTVLNTCSGWRWTGRSSTECLAGSSSCECRGPRRTSSISTSTSDSSNPERPSVPKLISSYSLAAMPA